MTEEPKQKAKQSGAHQALAEAIEIAGGQTQLGNMIGEPQDNIWWWLNRSKKGVPAKIARKIDEALSGQVTKERLCPDAYAEECEVVGV